jgi:hypothetical protein
MVWSRVTLPLPISPANFIFFVEYFRDVSHLLSTYGGLAFIASDVQVSGSVPDDLAGVASRQYFAFLNTIHADTFARIIFICRRYWRGHASMRGGVSHIFFSRLVSGCRNNIVRSLEAAP